ncbi:box C/D snoRNA protein 1-like [Dreissena polymorpha]|uniref:HIT-type domain-containing protein n=1 Tax=Dreissena polymorpha TaxID=45954 RepID=A0A9D4F4E0_DREPO|nr:box C/D snoRNA protein 1-like [Dreissena polymorpha]XP_052222092.1 box C/D snoRNA protein 1-like [Dreissena polymorpha]KAH3792129.1 hypothetical protein DPMN_145620 [Dreissena polymorpha]
MKKCEVCSEVEAKYRCPRCELQTCCLKCVRQHKETSGCSGLRDKTAFIAVTEFNDRHLLNDYRFLEDCGRKNSNASRDQLKRTSNKPNFLKVLENQARNRKVRLRLMPYPMSKRKHNSTMYQHRLKTILWQVEWRFPEVEYSTIDRRVPETHILGDILDKHFSVDADPVVRHRLKRFVEDREPSCLVLMERRGATQSDTSYYQLDLKKTLAENLQEKEIVEYPTLTVVTQGKLSDYKIVSCDILTNDLKTSDGKQPGLKDKEEGENRLSEKAFA